MKESRALSPGACVTLAIAAALLLAAGCGVERALWTPPTMQLRGVALAGVGPLGGRARVRLLVRNENPYALTTKALSYRLLASDTVEVARGDDTARHTIAAHDSALVDLSVDISWRGLQSAGGALVATGEVPYRVAGRVTLDTPIGQRSVPFDDRGRFAPLRLR